MMIEDGTGKGYKAKVGADNRLKTFSVSEEAVIHNGEYGRAFNWNTGNISMSGDMTLIYLKNNSDDDLVISDIAIAIGDGITYSDFPQITVVRNPTGGDLITDATAISMNQNRNFGSSEVADVNVYKGKVSGTCTGGNNIALLQCSKTGRSFFSLNLILPKGTSIGVTVDSGVSSGSANIYGALIGYFKPDTDS